MSGGAVFRLAGKVPPTLEELRKGSLNTSLQMVVLAFMVLILKRL